MGVKIPNVLKSMISSFRERLKNSLVVVRIFFCPTGTPLVLSLKPHLLSGADDTEISDMNEDSNFDFDKENAYYSRIETIENEPKNLPKFVPAIAYRLDQRKLSSSHKIGQI